MKVGDTVPDTRLQQLTPEGPVDVLLAQYSDARKVVVFGVPGAFTPTCSESHLPGFVQHANAIKSKGVGAIACLSTADFFVMAAWAKSLGVDNSIDMLSDGNGQFVQDTELALDLSSIGLGTRTQRFAAVIEDGVVTHLVVEDDATQATQTSAEGVLAHLSA